MPVFEISTKLKIDLASKKFKNVLQSFRREEVRKLTTVRDK